MGIIAFVSKISHLSLVHAALLLDAIFDAFIVIILKGTNLIIQNNQIFLIDLERIFQRKNPENLILPRLLGIFCAQFVDITK